MFVIKSSTMKNLLASFLFVLTLNGLNAQCFAFFDLTAIGTDATAEFQGSGANNPMYVVDWGDGQIDTSFSSVLEYSYSGPGEYLVIYYYIDLADPSCNYFSFYPHIITGGSCSLTFQTLSLAEAVLVEAQPFNTTVPLFTIDWGDQSEPTADNEGVHAYASPGVYNICVNLTDGDTNFPCDVTQCQLVEVLGSTPGCAVNFDASVQGETVTLDLLGSITPGSDYFIDWGDGSFSEAGDTTHVYPIADFYTICLYYGSPVKGSCQTSVCQEVYVDPFTADCALQFVPVVNGMDVELQILASGAEQPEIYIDWGDGLPGQYGLPAMYSYGAEGSYLICVSYTDLLNPIGCQINSCVDVEIGASPDMCDVSLTVTNGGPDNPNVVSVAAVGSGAQSPTYVVNWGDNSSPLLADAGSHTYAANGAYEICVTYGDEQNPDCIATACQTVNITTSIEEMDGLGVLQISPIPLADRSVVSFNLRYPGEVVLELLDACGRLVIPVYRGSAGQGMTTINWDTQAIASGYYVLRLVTQGGRFTQSVVR